MLWRISKPGQRPSHLLGTIHSPDPRVANLRPAVSQALKGKSFIAVGALHLAGPQGLIALLRQNGYQVTAVRLRP